MSTPRWLSAIELLEQPPRRRLDDAGRATTAAAVVDLMMLGGEPGCDLLSRLERAAADSDIILLGCCGPDQVDSLAPLLEAFTVTLVEGRPDRLLPRTCIAAEPAVAVREIAHVIERAPMAALVLNDLLSAASPALSVQDGLVAESAAYSMLLAAEEFAAWRSGRPLRDDPGPGDPAVLLSRQGADLTLRLNRPDRHNAFSRWVRDAVCEGLDLALVDTTIHRVTICGAGPSFCSGGDLDEFGSQPDVAAAHQIRLERSVASRLHRLTAHTVADVHGACIGAGTELAAFADRVRARPGTWFALPEVSMGLIPGAGGTVSLPRRIGRWRTAWLAMSGRRLDLDTAVAWGLVDERVES